MRRSVACAILAFACASACSQRADVRKLRFMENGRRFYDKGDYSRAIIEWKNAVGIANGDAEPYYWLGMGYIGAGNIPLAVDSFRKAAEINPKHAAAQLHMAELLTLSNDPDLLQDALKRLQIVLNAAPSANALNAIALTEFKLGNEENTQSYLEDALARFPQSMSSYVILAKLKILKRDLPGAEDVLKKAVAASPNSADARLALADFYVAAGRMPDAEKLMREALALDQKSGLPLFNLALLEYRLGRKSEAEEHFRQLSQYPDPQFKSMHAIYSFKEGDKQGAVAELEKLARDNPKEIGIRSRLLAAYWAVNRLDLVERVLNEAIKKQPKDLEAVLQRGELYVATDRFPQAQADLEQVLALRPDAAVVHFVLAKLQQARGSDVGYRQELQEAIRLNPGLLQARLDLARRLTESGAPESAVKLLDEAPEIDRINLALIAERNWALLAQKDYAELQKNLKIDLSQARLPDLLAQDGWVKIKQKDYAAARASLEEGLKKAPSDIRLLTALAAAYAAEHKTSEFSARIRQYAQDNKSPEVDYFAGEWLRQAGDRAGARTFLAAAKAADPGFHETDLGLAALDVADGKLDSAQKLLTQLANLRDRDVSLRAKIADLDIQQQRVPEAIDQYRKILAVDRGNVYALNNLAYLLASQNQADEGLAYAQQAKELAPTLPQVDDTLGWVLYQKAVYGEAVMHLEAAAAKKSSDPAIEYHLGLAYYKTGNDERGARLLKQALKQAPNMAEAKLARQQMGIE
jgi:tetratricopeptide (TPR) repeat protein